MHHLLYRYGINAVGIKDKAYFFGGCSSMEGGVFFDEVMELNLNTFAWRVIAVSGDLP
jgi:hypothetical protein